MTGKGKSPLTIFGEVVKEGDKILYMYKAHGEYRWSFGIVESITWKDDSHPNYYTQYVIKVRRVWVLNGWDKGPCDQIVRLTAPTMLKVGSTITMPTDTIIQGM